ncbi:penicillin-binding protein 2 [uncultured Thiothrix sp.]|uniref:penicillin-binding protein 2 n=1 Tax=uncultured Thiothrix sp. TaxID=223185 RepID=UPI00262F3582|nr:penicillin-binding protein 2 [uncultured Thiothrix sp.]
MGERLSIKTERDEQQLFNSRAIVAGLIVLIALCGIGTRLYFLQVKEHDTYTELSKQNYQKHIPRPPTRGQIYDRNGVKLADNHAQYILEVVWDSVPDQNDDGRKRWDDMQMMLERLNKIVPLSEKDLRIFGQQVNRHSRYQPTPLKENLTEQEMAMFAVNKSRFPGVNLERRMQRFYPLGTVASHVIGYVGRIDDRDLERLDKNNYAGTSHIGKVGVEAAHEDRLHGQAGYDLDEVDAHGRGQDMIERKEAVGGQDLILGLDINLQLKAEALLKGERGAVVAIDPRNGEVLAMASVPTFDPNLFVDGISSKIYTELRDDPDRPLYNRALQGAYPPGSTVKPMNTMAGLYEKVIWPGKTVYDPGFFQIPGHKHRYRCWKKSGHGGVSMDYAIAQSCDTFFYDMAYRMGVDKFSGYMSLFGFGKKTGVDLTSESDGLMPTPEWKQRRYKQVWYPGDTVNIGIGQGYWLATPIQLAHATASVAMRGKRIRPHVLRAFRTAKDRPEQILEPEVIAQIPARDKRHWEMVVQGMVHVVHASYGTAKRVGIGAPYTIAGKTGTAQVFGIAQNARYDASRLAKRLHDHALFVGFAPADNPQIAVSVIVENGGGGSSTAAPIARKVMDAYLLKKYDDETPVEETGEVEPADIVPRVEGADE